MSGANGAGFGADGRKIADSAVCGDSPSRGARDTTGGGTGPAVSAADSTGSRNGSPGGTPPPLRRRRHRRPGLASRLAGFLRANAFVLAFAVGFWALDAAVAALDPVGRSDRFYKDDFTKTILRHGGARKGPVFFGNSAVTGAYIEEQAEIPLVEMGLAYGKLTDLKAILQKRLYEPEGVLLIGIDPHAMLDKLETDPFYPWHRKPWEPYLYFYRGPIRDAAEAAVRTLWRGLRDERRIDLSYKPAWMGKQLYFGRLPPDKLRDKWNEYERRFGGMTVERDMRRNLEALEWVLDYAEKRRLFVGVVWMPVNPDPAYPPQRYWRPLRETVGALLARRGVPVLDLADRFAPEDFHDLVHLERNTGAPKFTREVDAWLRSSANFSKSPST